MGGETEWVLLYQRCYKVLVIHCFEEEPDNMSYRFELHCHTAEVSYCASCRAEQSVALLKEAGYDGVAVTNHYYRDWFTSKEGSWPEKTQVWLSGYRLAKEAGERLDLAVVLGVELAFDSCPNNHFLSFGMEESFLNCIRDCMK